MLVDFFGIDILYSNAKMELVVFKIYTTNEYFCNGYIYVKLSSYWLQKTIFIQYDINYKFIVINIC